MTPARNLPLHVPALDGRCGSANGGCHGPDTAEFLKDAQHEPLQSAHDVRFADRNRTSDVRQSHSLPVCDFRIIAAMGPKEIVVELKRLQVPHEEIARVIGRDRTAATKMMNGTRSVKTNEQEGLRDLIARYGGDTPQAQPNPPVSVVARPKDIGRRIPVVGDVEAGAWRETVAREAYEIDEYLPLDVLGYESARLKALKVVGPSMNKLYPPGRYVVIAEPADAGVRDGDHVVVERRKGSMTEITLKEFVREDDGRIALWPRSDHPDFQEPFYLQAREESDQDGVAIIGIVVADYRRRDRPTP